MLLELKGIFYNDKRVNQLRRYNNTNFVYSWKNFKIYEANINITESQDK